MLFPWSEPIATLAQRVARKEISPVELTMLYLSRIRQYDGSIAAFVEVYEEEALQAARVAEDQLMHRNYRGPLHGLPFAVKDLYHVKGRSTKAGSKVYEQLIADETATIVEKLQHAGAILLGKTTTTEFAFFGAPPPTCNPWNSEHTPGGSSSGSAAAMAARFAQFTLGTQTAGSLSRPASFNAITTLKPTYGRISRYGVVPLSWTLDHLGYFTYFAEDQDILLSLSSFKDERDMTTYLQPTWEKGLMDYSAVKGYTLGIPKNYFEERMDASMGKIFAQGIEIFRSLGMRIVSIDMPQSLDAANDALWLIMRVEAATYHRDSFLKNPDLYNPSLRDALAIGMAAQAVDYLQAQRIRQVYFLELRQIFRSVDLLLTPASVGYAPKGLHATGSPEMNIPFTNAGVPTLTIPGGFDMDTGLPLGLQLVADVWQEKKLIAAGSAFQHQTDWHLRLPARVFE